MSRLPLIAPPRPPRLSEQVEALARVEASGIYSNNGPEVRAFEAEVTGALFGGTGASLAVANATLGLMIAIREAAGMQPAPGTLALIPALTFAATAEAAYWAGLTPLVADVDPDDWSLDPAAEERLLHHYGPRIGVLIPYATFSNAIDLDRYRCLAEYFGVGVVMRARMARLISVDDGNPFIKRPSSCRIAGHDLTLAWRPITAEALAVANAPYAQLRDPTVWSTPFGANGEWIHMGIFFADNREVAAHYHALYARLPAMRVKDVLVLDVRGNGGGSYNRFMGFLRALYGDEYTAYHARARLKIQPLYADDPAKLDPTPAGTPQIEEPLDAPLVKAEGSAVRVKLPNGRTVY